MTTTAPAVSIHRQWQQIKTTYPDAILLFRIGDFYEAFEQDAEIVANTLDVVLASRKDDNGERRPMAGIPYRDAEQPIKRLIDAGHKVAICEQIGKVAPEIFNRQSEETPAVHHGPKTEGAPAVDQYAELVNEYNAATNALDPDVIAEAVGSLKKKVQADDDKALAERIAIFTHHANKSGAHGEPRAYWRLMLQVAVDEQRQRATPAPDLTIEPFDAERARRAHAHISFHPEERAEQERQEFYGTASAVLARALEIAQTDEQRAILHREYAAWYRDYLAKTYACLDAKSRTMSSMIAGRANFPARRNQRALTTEKKRYDERALWRTRAVNRLYAAIERARTPEQVSADRFARLRVEIDRAMTTAAAIDSGQMPGFNRQAFTTSISGMLKRLAANGEEETVRTALGYIREHQAAMPRPFFTDRNSVWRLG